MYLFLTALSVVCAIAVVFFMLVFALLIPFSELSEAASLAFLLAAWPLLALPATAEFLEREMARRRLAAGKQPSLQDYHEFHMAWPLTVTYGSVVLVALDCLSSVVVSAAAFEWEGPEEAGGDVTKIVFLLALFINIPTMMLGTYFVGRWIGSRSQKGLLAVVLTALLATAVACALTQLTPADVYDHALLFLNFLAFPVILLCGLLGYWSGRNKRWAKYASYLWSVFPPQTRDVFVDRAFAEASKALAAAKPADGDARSM
jgi:hypothetical protein